MTVHLRPLPAHPRRFLNITAVSGIVMLAVTARTAAADPAGLIVLNDDGAWCWFQDERAVLQDKLLICGSVANGTHDRARRGDIDLNILDIDSLETTRIELFDQLEPDDHDVPALWPRPDGTLLAVFAKHGSENRFYFRESTGRESTARESTAEDGHRDWKPTQTYSPTERSRITYSNLLFLAAENEGQGRLYNFYRGLDASFKPSYAWSDDWGRSWSSGNVVVDVPLKFRHRPYVKYCGNGSDTIHLLYTDGHPRNYDNSVYHVFYRNGNLHRSDGSPIVGLAQGLSQPGDGTRVFAGDADHVAWVSDAHLDADGRPRVVFSVQRNAAGLRSGHPEAGQDHRYYYATWTGDLWQHAEIAHGGTRLYAGEDDYTGNVCLDPDCPDTVYCSTDVHPATGQPLISRTDGKRHYEIFVGQTADAGMTFQWTPITRDSTVDNLRPIVPADHGPRTPVLWYRGTYRTYRDYQTEVVCLLVDDGDTAPEDVQVDPKPRHAQKR